MRRYLHQWPPLRREKYLTEKTERQYMVINEALLISRQAASKYGMSAVALEAMRKATHNAGKNEICLSWRECRIAASKLSSSKHRPKTRAEEKERRTKRAARSWLIFNRLCRESRINRAAY